MKVKHALAGALVLTLAVLAGPASATGNTYTVSVGGSTIDIPHDMYGSTSGSVAISLQRVGMPPFNSSCTSANLVGTGSAVNGGTSGGSSPTDIADLPDINFIGCTTIGGVATVVTSPMQLHGLSTATAGAVDVVQVHIDGINLTVSSVACAFRLSGAARGTFNEATQQLTINETGFSGGLTYARISGCLGQVPVSGNANLSFTMNVSTSGGAINIM